MCMQWYCDFSVLTFSLINGINEYLPGTQLELLHVKLFEWYGRFFESNDLSQAIHLSNSALNNVS